MYAHIPSVVMEEAERPFAGGRLAHLPFAEWQALESEFEYADGKYERAKPLFWIRELGDVVGGADELAVAAYRFLWDVHTAFLLDLAAPLIPTPILSCLYIVFPAPPDSGGVVLSSVRRYIGPLEREFIVYGSPYVYTFDSQRLGMIEALHGFLQSTRAHDMSGTIRAGIDVLEETSRPDSWYGGDLVLCRAHGFVRCMAAAERILLPQADELQKGEITRSFGRHAGALLGALFDDRDGVTEHAADLYRLRSEMMHGRKVPDPGDQTLAERLEDGRRLLRRVVYAALALRDHVSDSAPLWRWLGAAWDDAAQQQRIVAALRGGAPQ